MTLSLRQDRTLLRAESTSTRFVLAGITAPPAPRRGQRQPVNVALVIDRSGSMGGEKIRLAREAVAHALALLAPDDRFALVAYDDEMEVLVESTWATGEARKLALQRLAQVDARGSTDLAGGWLAGLTQALEHLSEQRVGRCLLLTDGLANVGLVEPDALAARAREWQQRGVSTSTFGVGRDFDEHLLQRIAASGTGHFYFLETPQQIPDLLASELGETLEIVARDAALVVTLPEGAEAVALGAFPLDRAGRIARVNLGHLVSSQELQLVVQLTFPTGVAGQGIAVGFRLADAKGALDQAGQTVTWTYASHAENDGQARDRLVDRAVAAAYAALARQQALALNGEGRYDEARHLLERVARKIRSYAGADAELQQIVRELLAETEEFVVHMDAIAAKKRHFAAYSQMQSRTPEGRSRRTS
jgi:Ca-activated chloride channel family protein